MIDEVKKSSLELSDSSDGDRRERRLIERISQGDEVAMEALYRLYFNRLFRFIFRTTRHFEIVEEVINDSMLVIWDKSSTFTGLCRPSTWIFGIAYNKARKAYSRRSRQVIGSVELSQIDHELPAETGDDWFRRYELHNWLETGMARLSLEQRVVMELTYFNGMHYAEIANIVGCPENTVKSRMYYARRNLLTELEKLNRE